MNKVIFMRRLAKDTEICYSQGGVLIASYTFAVDNKSLTNRQPILFVVSACFQSRLSLHSSIFTKW